MLDFFKRKWAYHARMGKYSSEQRRAALRGKINGISRRKWRSIHKETFLHSAEAVRMVENSKQCYYRYQCMADWTPCKKYVLKEKLMLGGYKYFTIETRGKDIYIEFGY